MAKVYFDPDEAFDVPYYKQEHRNSCGAACIRMLLARDGIDVDEDTVRKHCISLSTEYSGRFDCRAHLMTQCLQTYGYHATTVWSTSIVELVECCMKNSITPILLCHPSLKQLNGHYMLVTGQFGASIYVNDPDIEKGKSNRRIRKDELVELSHYTGHPMDQLGKSNIAIIVYQNAETIEKICPKCGHIEFIPKCVADTVVEYVCEKCAWWMDAKDQ